MIVSIFFLCRFIFSSQKLSWGKKCGIFRMECVNLRRERVTRRVKNQVRSVCVRCGRRRRLSACRAGMWQPERAAGNASKLPKNGSAPKLRRETLVVCELIHIRERAPSVALRGAGPAEGWGRALSGSAAEAALSAGRRLAAPPRASHSCMRPFMQHNLYSPDISRCVFWPCHNIIIIIIIVPSL